MDRLDYLISYLADVEKLKVEIPTDVSDKKRLFRALMNVFSPAPLSKEFLFYQDSYLQEEIRNKGIIHYDTLDRICPQIILWYGDIVTLACDVIVNAGNHQGLGCFVPGHSCIDNAIHSYAGLQLRNECASILQGQEISTGDYIVCDAYNLPSKKVITTVGPQIQGKVKQEDEISLASCYRGPLEYAIQHGYSSIAFPSISTGLYGYPIELSKRIVYQTVQDVLRSSQSVITVILVVFSQEDYDVYRKMFTN